MEKQHGYRGEQLRALRRGFARRMVAGLLAWTALFGVWAVAVDAFVAPRLADAISSACPWRTLSAQEADLDDTVWFEASLEKTRVTMISCYAALLADDKTAYDRASDDARGVSDALGAATGGAKSSGVDSSDAATSGDGAMADQGAATGRESASDASDASGKDGFSDGALQNLDAAADGSMHEYRSAMPSEDAVVAGILADRDEASKQALFEEACAALGTDPSAVRVESPWSTEQARQLWNEMYYADGHMEYRDLGFYDFVRSLRLPMSVVLYLAGVIAVLAFAFAWLTRCFASLFDAMETLFTKRDEEPGLPRELEPTARALADLRRGRDDAERAALAAEQRKNELVAYLAHDIRTPLTSIVGYLTLLAEAPDMPEAQRARYAQVALDRSYRLESMMEEFFEITRYNLGSIPIERERFDAALLCRQVADEFYPAAKARSIDIEVCADDPIECFADAEKVSRVLSNLLKNAVAYADKESTVTVRARCEDALGAVGKEERDATCRALVVDVENQGREIGPEHLQSIFEKFYREDGARSTEGGGAGLGLAIAREIARAHGGDLTATSVAGRTVFTLRIPV
ncbi:MAG: HAMP domain-containing sensor histidine kinase [Slackia faecicanis]|nr:HAMP domain-containing sensor histidine kinase [Slackia faecicanis]